MRAVNAKGEGEFSSPSAPEHPLRPPDAPARTGRRARRQDDHRQLGRTRQRRRPDHRVPGADPVVRRDEHARRARRSAGPTCPTASPSSSRSGPATAPTGAPWSPASAAVVPCGVPDAPTNVARHARRPERRRDVDRTEQPGLRDHRLHGARQRRRRHERRRRPDVGDGRRPQQRHELHVHRRSPATRSATAPPARPPTPSCRPARRAPRRSRAPTPDTGRVTVTWTPRARQRQRRSPRYQLSVERRRLGERRHRHVVHPDRARQRHAVLVPGARRQRRRARAPAATPSTPGRPGEPDAGRRPRRRRRRPAHRRHAGRRRTTTASRSPATRSTSDPGGIGNVERQRRTRGTACSDDTAYTRARPGLQRRRLRCVERDARAPRTPPAAGDHASAAAHRSTAADCDTPSCAYFHINASGLAAEHPLPGRLLLVERAASSTPAPRTCSSGPRRRHQQDTSCYFGYPGATVCVTLERHPIQQHVTW